MEKITNMSVVPIYTTEWVQRSLIRILHVRERHQAQSNRGKGVSVAVRPASPQIPSILDYKFRIAEMDHRQPRRDEISYAYKMCSTHTHNLSLSLFLFLSFFLSLFLSLSVEFVLAMYICTYSQRSYFLQSVGGNFFDE
jgi:hypothetical protein